MGEHKITCGSCEKILVEGPEPTTNGICKSCTEDYIEDLKKGGKKWKIVGGIPRRLTEACG